jgi:hypothetical protein
MKKSRILIYIIILFILIVTVKAQPYSQKEIVFRAEKSDHTHQANWVWLRGWLWDCQNKGEIYSAKAVKLHYKVYTPFMTESGLIEDKIVEFSNKKIFGRIFDFGSVGRLTYVFALFQGDLIIKENIYIKNQIDVILDTI